MFQSLQGRESKTINSQDNYVKAIKINSDENNRKADKEREATYGKKRKERQENNYEFKCFKCYTLKWNVLSNWFKSGLFFFRFLCYSISFAYI